MSEGLLKSVSLTPTVRRIRHVTGGADEDARMRRLPLAHGQRLLVRASRDALLNEHGEPCDRSAVIHLAALGGGLGSDGRLCAAIRAGASRPFAVRDPRL